MTPKRRTSQMLHSVTLVDPFVQARAWACRLLDCVAGHLASTAQATASVVAVLSCAATTVCRMLIRDNNAAKEKVAVVGQ